MQGEDEGITPDKRLYEALIKSLCRRGELSQGLMRLQDMQSKRLQPDKDHISALVTAHALAGKTYGKAFFHLLKNAMSLLRSQCMMILHVLQKLRLC